MENIFSVSGKVALITGGRRGLGKAMALGLARAGALVAVAARSDNPGDLEREIGDAGGRLFYLPADLLKPDERMGLVDRVAAHYGRLDILVNNAGLQHRAPALDYPLAQWHDDFELMLTAVLDLSQQAAKVMIPRGGGKIIHIASISSFQGARQIVGYAAAKHALVGLTKCLANEWASSHINVNAIAPGLFVTEMASHVSSDPKKSAELLGRIPSGRFGEPEDMIGPVIFLASDASRHVHGHVLLVDGGWMGR
ncbi:MAG: SDR family oxidoreductase [Candidatus Eremiobacteraeota bacterium]|nr:SDR family oxidoreductase [Candidatus Eremiobacteraeota bacterium]